MNVLEKKVRESIVVPETAEDEVLFEWRFNGGLEILAKYLKQESIPIHVVTVDVAADYISRYLYHLYDYNSKRDYGPRKVN